MTEDERVEQYAEAMHRATCRERVKFWTCPHDGSLAWDRWGEAAAAVADAEVAKWKQAAHEFEDEVERLRAALNFKRETIEDISRDCVRAEAEVERLRGEVGQKERLLATMDHFAEVAETCERKTNEALSRLAAVEALAEEHWLDPVNYREPVASVLRTIQTRLRALAVPAMSADVCGAVHCAKNRPPSNAPHTCMRHPDHLAHGIPHGDLSVPPFEGWGPEPRHLLEAQ